MTLVDLHQKTAAINALVAHPFETNFRTSDQSLELDRADLVNVATQTEEGSFLVARLAALPCKCKAKTTIVPSKQLSIAEIQMLDDSPFGAKVIKDQDVTLGLPLASH